MTMENIDQRDWSQDDYETARVEYLPGECEFCGQINCQIATYSTNLRIWETECTQESDAD